MASFLPPICAIGTMMTTTMPTMAPARHFLYLFLASLSLFPPSFLFSLFQLSYVLFNVFSYLFEKRIACYPLYHIEHQPGNHVPKPSKALETPNLAVFFYYLQMKSYIWSTQVHGSMMFSYAGWLAMREIVADNCTAVQPHSLQ